MIKQANHWCCIKDFIIENKVMINIQNFISNQSIKILNDKRYKSFRILQQFHFFYKLDIPSEWYIIDIFYISNFIKITDSKWLLLIEQRNPLPELAVINNKNQTEWMLEKILNSQYSGSNCHLQYKIHWFNCDPDSTWYNTDNNKFQNVFKILHKYYV